MTITGKVRLLSLPLALALAGSGLLASPSLAGDGTDGAVDAYHQAILLNPRLVPTVRNEVVRARLRARFLSDAEQARSSARLPEAERNYLLAGNFGEDFDLFVALGRVYMDMEAWSKAVVVFKKALVANPASPAAIASLALAYQKAGQEELAAQFFARAISLDATVLTKLELPSDLRAKVRDELVEKARSLLDRKMPLDAAAKLELALSLTEDPSLRIQQGSAFLAAGDRAAAARAMARAAAASDAAVASIPKSLTEATAAILHEEASAAFQAKDLARAKHLFDRSSSLHETAQTHYNLGNVHVHAGQLDTAVSYYRKAIAKDAGLDEARLNLAMVQIEKGLHLAAIRDLKGLIAVRPERAEAYDLIAQAYSALGQPAKAVKVYQAAVNFDPGLAARLSHVDVRRAASLAFLEEARQAFTARDLPGAAESCRRSLALHASAGGRYLLGNVLFAMDDPLAAVEAYKEALVQNPRHAPTLNNLGNAHLKLKDYPAAAKAFREATQARPDYAQAFNNLGIALRKSGKTKEAIAAYQKALEIDPEYAAAYFNLGNAYQALGAL